MANQIDDRVVAMEFDNVAFERKLGTTLQSLEKLQKSLDFANSGKGLNDLSAAASKFDLSHLGHAVEGIAGKFSALGVTAFTVLQNITNRAVDAGINIAKSLSVKPIMEGFQEYEVNMGSIQTILANTKDKGSNLEDVNVALDKLNHYSDQTIYNFSQMARNIGTFTAAGVGLDESVKSIKGIANLAAISGSTSEQASTAMYQLSQALAAGKVNLMDWNSVVNAGMGGEVFKKALFETGKAMKTITDVPVGASFEDWEKKGGTFREQMQNGWLTSDVLATTLQGLSGDLDEAKLKALGFGDAAAQKLVQLGKDGAEAAQTVKTLTQLMSTLKEGVASGWATSFRTIIGDFEQSKELWTDVNKAVGGALARSSESRNKMLKEWADFGGRTALIEALKDVVGSLSNVFGAVSKAFRSIFPPATSATLVILTDKFAQFAEKLRQLTFDYIPRITQLFKGLFGGIEIGVVVVKNIAELFVNLFKALTPDDSGGQILQFFGKIAGWLIELNHILVTEGGIEEFFDKLEGWILNPAGAVDVLKKKFDELGERFPSLEQAIDKIQELFGRLTSRFDHLEESVDRVKSVWDRFGDGAEKVKDVLSNIWEYISNWFSELGSKLAAVMQPGDFNAAVDIVNVGLLGGMLIAVKRFLGKLQEFDFTGGLITKAGDLLDVLRERAKLMQTEIKADILLKIAGAIGILAASMLVLSMIDSAALTKALIAMGVGFGQIVVVMKALEGIGGPKSAATLNLIGTAMITVASSMVILAGAIRILSKIDPGDLASGLVGLTAGLAVMVGAMQLMSTNAKGLIAGSIAMNGMATSMIILAGAIKAFATISWEEMGRGLFGLATSLGILVVAMNLMPVHSTLAAGLAMIPLATGISILAGALKLFALISWEEMGRGLFGMAVALGVVAVAMNAMPLTLPITAAGLILVGIALGLVAGALAAIALIEVGNLVKSVLAVAAMMTILAVALNVMNGTAAGAAALLIASAALVVLTHVLTTLGAMSLKQIAIGLGAIAATMAVLGIGSMLLTPAIPAILAFANSMLQLGLSFALFGAGVWLVAKGFETLAESGRAGATAIVDILVIIVKGIPEILGAFVTSLGEMVGELGAALGLIVRTLGTLLGHIIDTVIELTPKIVQLFITLITASLDSMTALLPRIIAFGFDMLRAFLGGIRDNIVEVTNMALDIVIAFTQTIAGSAQRIVDTALGLLASFVSAITERMPQIVLMGLGLLLSFIQGISDNINKIVEAVGMLIATFIWTAGTYTAQIIRLGADMLIYLIRGFGSKVNDVITAGVDVIIAFIQGISDNALRLANAAADTLISFINGLTTAIETKAPELREAGKKLAIAIVDGATGGLASKAKELADKATGIFGDAVGAVKGILDSNSPSMVFFRIGKDMAGGAVLALSRDTSVRASAVGMAERAVDGFQEAISRIPDALGDMREFNPTITPVLDLSNVYSGAKGLDALMRVSTIVPDVSFAAARHIATTTELEQEGTDGGDLNPGGDVIFNQFNTSPLALNTNDIYKKTRSQIALAKEELGIPS